MIGCGGRFVGLQPTSILVCVTSYHTTNDMCAGIHIVAALWYWLQKIFMQNDAIDYNKLKLSHKEAVSRCGR